MSQPRQILNEIVELGFKDKLSTGLSRIKAFLSARHGAGAESVKAALKSEAAREGARAVPTAVAAGARSAVRSSGRYIRGFVTGTPAPAPDVASSVMRGVGEWGKSLPSAESFKTAAIGGGALLAGAGVYRAGGRKNERGFSAREELDTILLGRGAMSVAAGVVAPGAVPARGGVMQKIAAIAMKARRKSIKKSDLLTSYIENRLSAREELDTILLGAGYGKLKQTLHSDGNGNITGAEFDVENEKGILAHMKRNAGKYASLPLGVAMAGVSGNAGVGLVPVLGGTVVDGFRKQRQIKKRLKEEGYMLSVRDQLDTILFGPGDWRDKASDNAGAVAAASGAVGGLSSYVRGGVENSANWTNKRRVMGSLAGGAVAGLGGYAIAKLLKKDKPGQAQVAGRIGSGHQNSLSARDELNLIALGVDANGKLHNSKGEFGGDNDAVAHPEAMRMAYQRAAGLGATAGAAGVAGGMGMKALIEKLKGLKRK
jgi:hypothetical protein